MYFPVQEIEKLKSAEPNRLRSFWLRHKKDLLALSLYAIITFIMTFPVVFRLDSEIPIWRSDPYQVIGRIQEQINIFQNNGFLGGMLLLAKNYQISIISLYSVPGLLIGKIFAYNIIFLSSFILSGFAAYSLAFYFTRSRYASFLAGLIYAFSPFHFYHSLTAQAGTMHQEWLPFFVLFLFKFFEDFKLKYFFITAFFFLVIAITEHQLLAFTAIFIGIFVIFKILTQPSLLKKKRFILFSIAFILLLACIALALFSPLIKIATSPENYLNPGIDQVKQYSISPIDPFIPAATHSLWPNLHQAMLSIMQKNTRLDIGKIGERMSSSFLSYTGIFLTITSFLLLLPIRKLVSADYFGKSRRIIIFWTFIFIVFYIFSLGPAIIFDGREINMPYNLIYKNLPFYENIKATSRFFVYSILSISILASFGCAFLIKRFISRKFILTGILGLAILLEFATAPIPTTSLSYSPFYDRIAKEPGNFKLLEIPGSTNYNFASFQMMTNSIHQKPVINGVTISRKIDGQFDLQKNVPVIRHLLYNLPKNDEKSSNNSSGIIKNNYFNVATDILNYYNIKYITIQKKFINEDRITDAIINFIDGYIKVDDTYEDDDLIAYKVRDIAPQAFYSNIINPGEKWSETIWGVKSKVNYRRAASGAEIQLENMSNSQKNIHASFGARAENPKKISFGDKSGKELSSFEISSGWQTYQFDFQIEPGSNTLILRQFDENGNEIKSKEKDQLVSVSKVIFSQVE